MNTADTVTTEELRQVVLEIAAGVGDCDMALAMAVGQMRTICGYHFGAKGQSYADALMASETMVRLLVDEVVELREAVRAHGRRPQ